MISPPFTGETNLSECNSLTGQKDLGNPICGTDPTAFLTTLLGLIAMLNPLNTQSLGPEKAPAVQSQQDHEISMDREQSFLNANLLYLGPSTCQMVSNSANVLAEKSSFLTHTPSPSPYNSSKALDKLAQSQERASIAEVEKKVISETLPSAEDRIGLLESRKQTAENRQCETLSSASLPQDRDVFQTKGERSERFVDNAMDLSVVFNKVEREALESPFSYRQTSLLDSRQGGMIYIETKEVNGLESNKATELQSNNIRITSCFPAAPMIYSSTALPESRSLEIATLPVSKHLLPDLDVKLSHGTDLSALKVTVEHDGLGELDIKLVLNKGIINGQIKTPEAATADLIIRNMPDIINSLIRDGLNIGNLSVSLKDSGKQYRDNFDPGKYGDREETSRRQTSPLPSIIPVTGKINIFV